MKLRRKNTMSNSGCCQLLCPTKNSGENWFNKNPFRVPKTLGSSIIPGLESKWLITSTFLTLHPSPFTPPLVNGTPCCCQGHSLPGPWTLAGAPMKPGQPLTHPPGVGYLHGAKKKKTAPASKGGGRAPEKNWAMINQNLKFCNPKKPGLALQTPNSKKPPTRKNQF